MFYKSAYPKGAEMKVNMGKVIKNQPFVQIQFPVKKKDHSVAIHRRHKSSNLLNLKYVNPKDKLSLERNVQIKLIRQIGKGQNVVKNKFY
jgi:hypothetical protein